MPSKHICLRISPEHLEIIKECMKILKTENMTEAILTIIEDWGRPSTPQLSVTKWESFPCLMRVLYEGKQEFCTELDKNRPIAIPSRFVKVAYCQACYIARNRISEKKFSPTQSEPKISQPPRISEPYENTLAYKRKIDALRPTSEKEISVLCSLKNEFRLKANLNLDECLRCEDQNCQMKKTLSSYQ